MESRQAINRARDVREAVKKGSELPHLLQGDILEVDGFHAVLYRVGKDFSEQFLEVGKLLHLRSKNISLRLEADEVRDGIKPGLYLLNRHEWSHAPSLQLSLAELSLAVVHILEQAALFLAISCLDNLQMLQGLCIKHHILKTSFTSTHNIAAFRRVLFVISWFERLLVHQSVDQESDCHSECIEAQIFLLVFEVAQRFWPLGTVLPEIPFNLCASLHEAVALVGVQWCENWHGRRVLEHLYKITVHHLPLKNHLDRSDLAN